MRKDRYEISLWEDYIVNTTYKQAIEIKDEEYYYFYNEVDNIYSLPILGSNINQYPDVETWYVVDVAAHYEERKLGVIGSNTMDVQWRAREPKLVENINGSNIFTFKMFYTYTDTITGEKVENPFLKLLVNERKVKVLWKNKWYDLIIKNRQEDSNNKSITFTCKDLFINELSKTGFNLEFSNELMNNSGTAAELGQRVLEGTDWQLRQSDIIRQKTEEPVYEVKLSQDIVVKDSNHEDALIPAGANILVFYSVVQNKAEYFQFLYADSYKKDSSSMLVSNGEVYSANVTWTESEENGIKYDIVTLGNAQIKFSKEIKVSTEYRAERLVRQQLQVFDTLIDQYVYKYTSEYLPVEQTNEEQPYYVLNTNNEFVEATSLDDGNEIYYIHSEEPAIIYGYSDTVYNDATTVINLLSNNGYDGFSDTSGWTSIDDNAMLFGVFPKYTTLEEAENFVINGKGFLFFKGKSDGCRYRNSGIRDSLQYLDDGFQRGEKYIFRYAVSLNDSNTNEPKISNNKVVYYQPTTDIDLPIEPRLGIYNDDFTLSSDNVYFSRKNQGFKCVSDEEKGLIWIEIPFICKKTITKNELQLTSNFGFIFKVNKDCWLREAQFFKYAEGEDKEGNIVRMNPNEIKTSAIVQVEYKYYNSNNDFKDQDEISHLYAGLEPWNIPGLKPIYATKEIVDSNGVTKIIDSFEQVRSIEGKQSNRFNLIQKIAETFECYAKFTIEHDLETGRILYDNGIPQKFVSFHEEIGQRTGLGFIYGIDLKTISRTITSDQIVTKTIVSPNSNEFAKNGFCTIARANSNPSKQNFILNFDYYISHGLLDNASLINDLYDTSTHIGYYPNLRKWSDLYDSITELYSKKKTELEKLQSTLHVYETYVKSGEEKITQIITDLGMLAGLTGTITQNRINDYLESHPDFDDVRTLKLAWSNTANNIASYNAQITDLNSQIDLLQQVIDNYDEQREQYAKEIEKLDEKFYNKYSRFIQEGSWIKEEYVDDELYYIDAQSVAYTSSRPQTQYNISVLRLSALDEFKHKVFKLGDIGYIQDTEFFGYTIIDNIKTPYKEEVLISEVTSNFDSPENDSFKVQNYKTQFEDLFQRITATTQQLQYAKGEYQKAANIVESDGTSIKASILQNTLALNQNIMISSQNNAFTQDSTGLTVTDVSNPNKKVKITSGGILFTNDGVNWKTGIDAAGMRADYLTTGSININNITVFSGKYPTFRWTSSGLDAYRFTNDGVDFGDFVRFDQYGIYGILDNQDFIPTQEGDIWDNASFGMTWEGFFVKNKDDNGRVEVSSKNDIAIFKNNLEEPKIKIGRLGKSLVDGVEKTIYGIKIADDDGHPVLITHDNGTLWLEEKLHVQTYNTQNSVQIGRLDEIAYESVNLSESGEFEDGQTYYKLDENGNFVIVPSDEAYDSAVNYYILTNDGHGGRVIDANNTFVVYEDGSIRATNGIFSGQLSAATGSFSGTLTAATGSFSGEITATSGTIGEVEINANGLKVINSGLEIVKQEYKPYENIDKFEDNKTYYILNDNGDYEEVVEYQEGINYYYLTEFPLLYYNETDKVLELTGDAVFSGELNAASGTFTGTLSAATGSFSGEITAQSGSIGGFIIGENSIESTDGKIKLFNQSITGGSSIEVDNIKLGVGAEISDYIKLGDAYIKNPTNHNGVFIEANQIKFYDNGVAHFGDLLIDGNNSIIKANNESFVITPTEAVFENITARGVFNASVFKIGEVQSVGGVMIFKPSTKIIKYDITDKTITIEKTDEKYFLIDDYVYITGNNYKVKTKIKGKKEVDGSIVLTVEDLTNITTTNIQSTNDQTVEKILSQPEILTFLSRINNYYEPTFDTSFANNKQYYEKDVNNQYIITPDEDYIENKTYYELLRPSDNLIVGVNSNYEQMDFLIGKGFSFIETQEVDGKLDTTSLKLFLGDLSRLNKTGITGYGLYGENVYLTGSLTTQTGNNTNTTYAGVNTLDGVTSTKFDSTERIVFWGGAQDNTAAAIQESPFQVTDKGSLYASKGLFTGSIITDSSIYAGALYATKLYGWSGDELGSGAALQIYDTTNGIQFFASSGDSLADLTLNTSGFSKGIKTFIGFTGNEINFTGDKISCTQVEIDENLTMTSTSIQTEDNNWISFNSNILTVGDNKTSVKTYDLNNDGNFTTSKNVNFGNGKMEYQHTDNGYDLYVS